jgi:hypothetical protein
VSGVQRYEPVGVRSRSEEVAMEEAPNGGWVDHADYARLAARVGELEREREKLRDALKPLADAAACCDPTGPNHRKVHQDYDDTELTYGDCRRARDVMEGKDAR